jgi:hypothetical protein
VAANVFHSASGRSTRIGSSNQNRTLCGAIARAMLTEASLGIMGEL